MRVSDTAAEPRRRNPRGEGARLREEIVRAASTVLEEGGGDEAVTLRAVARVAGITAPSIYAHFADRDEILHAVAGETFAQLAAALRPALGGRRRPVPALLAVCRAYLDFAAEHPNLYRVLFERHRAEVVEPVDVTTPGDATAAGRGVPPLVGADAFGVVVDAVQACMDAGESEAVSAHEAAVRVWVSLHGTATLRASLPWFPWPPRERLLDELVTRAADLDRASRPPRRQVVKQVVTHR